MYMIEIKKLLFSNFHRIKETLVASMILTFFEAVKKDKKVDFFLLLSFFTRCIREKVVFKALSDLSYIKRNSHSKLNILF